MLVSPGTLKSSEYGGSEAAIRYHYDVSRNFYGLWLDETLTYSCAYWNETWTDELLVDAQRHKIDYHLETARAHEARAILDIGCGWGALLQSASRIPGIELLVGLTLSQDQYDYARKLAISKTEIRLESWTKHEPKVTYDSIISVGAFEHFAKPEDSSSRKISLYRDFFETCSRWLAPNGRMSLQTIAYGNMRNEEASAFINNEIFPAADLPRLEEIAAASDGIIEIIHIFNHRLHYARTFEQWAHNLSRCRAEAVELVGEQITERYERYLKQSAIGFYMGKINLLRIGFQPIKRRSANIAAI
jgi:cyclopropane-fatty-acyl-phospholipid synthase